MRCPGNDTRPLAAQSMADQRERANIAIDALLQAIKGQDLPLSDWERADFNCAISLYKRGEFFHARLIALHGVTPLDRRGAEPPPPPAIDARTIDEYLAAFEVARDLRVATE